MFPGALTNLRVLDLSRVLAGPICTQILGDLGAEIIKIERPGVGDDTRTFGPPFLKDHNGNDTPESTYYACANRNKKSVAIDISTPDGQNLIHHLLADTDILVENFKVGSLEKYGLGYTQLVQRYPRLIYCSITGFGQTGPLSTEPGYDFIAQGMAGFMAATGSTGSSPTKAGVAVADYTTGLYATIGILAALQARTHTGRGQLVDCALLDSTLALMSNVAQYYLTSGHMPPKVGNAHASIVPYQDFESLDGHVIIAAGNDHLFGVLAHALDHPEWAKDEKFKTNIARAQHRDELLSLMRPIIKGRTTADWVDTLRAVNVPVGPILNVAQSFSEPQAIARNMRITLPGKDTHANTHLVGSALKLSDTPADYYLHPPRLGEHTNDILEEKLGLTKAQISQLRASKVIG